VQRRAHVPAELLRGAQRGLRNVRLSPHGNEDAFAEGDAFEDRRNSERVLWLT